ncbi:DNA mismatch repair protein MutS [Kribbella jejuensis]|uniref:MutS-like protein n=1 Tax=Kribbella jejuensis TaxID=236068 RepID=A0A542ELK0_9ACTN|nr:DNA mismatch repair protein MutS [Kribbella jejuensis]TQJ16223.1 MutS-like protein [Kribbella jejuensis]
MKPHLLDRDRDLDLDLDPPGPAKEDLVRDLGLDRVYDAMAAGDAVIREVAAHVVVSSLEDPDDIHYRQDVLRDCLREPAVIRGLYAIAVEALDSEQRVYRYFRSADGILHSSSQLLEVLLSALRRLREVADPAAGRFRSDGLSRFFRMIATDLDDGYFAAVDAQLKRLRFSDGVVLGAELGTGNRGTGYVLRRPGDGRRRRWLPRAGQDSVTIQIPDRDDSGVQALVQLREQGLNLVANAVAQSADHVLAFFRLLRTELAFYLGCLNLHDRLTAGGAPTCFPEVRTGLPFALTARGLYDAGLALRTGEQVVGNDLDADDAATILITGANQGGKSTALRSLGLAQLMLQAGMYVPAESLRASICRGIHTHYQREEDATMHSGKLDEELQRLSGIVDRLEPSALLLCNESFASTNEREGSALAGEILRALREADVRVVFVTHLTELSAALYDEHDPATLFLRAERLADGRRTFKLTEGPPHTTSHGEDLYQEVFATSLRPPERSGVGVA